MSDSQPPSAPMWPYVLAVGLVKLTCALLAYWYFTATGSYLNISSTTVTILAVGVALVWYSYAVNQPMRRAQMLRFATGVAIVDVLLSVIVVVGSIIWTGEALSAENIALVLGGDGSRLTTPNLVILGGVLLFTTVAVFLIGFAFAWMITRRLPMQRKRG
jgi:hypothetical protein